MHAADCICIHATKYLGMYKKIDWFSDTCNCLSWNLYLRAYANFIIFLLTKQNKTNDAVNLNLQKSIFQCLEFTFQINVNWQLLSLYWFFFVSTNYQMVPRLKFWDKMLNFYQNQASNGIASKKFLKLSKFGPLEISLFY